MGTYFTTEALLKNNRKKIIFLSQNIVCVFMLFWMDINSLKAVEKQKMLKNGEISQLLILYIYYYDHQDLDELIFFGVW